MNTHGFSRLLVSVFGGMLLALMLIPWASLQPASAQARTPSSSVLADINSPGSPARLSHAPATTFTPAFTVYLPTVTKNPSMPSNPCPPGQTIADPAYDVSPAHIDVTALSTVLNGESLRATFHMRDVPTQLTFNRVGVPHRNLEYGWGVYVDVDNDTQTGVSSGQYEGAEYRLSAMHFISLPDSPITQPIANGVQVNIWRFDPTENAWWTISKATLTVDPQLDTMTLTGNIPGINSGSRLFFVTSDLNPGGTYQMDVSSCGGTIGSDSRHMEIGVQRKPIE